MTNSMLYGLVLMVVICAAALTAVFSPTSVPIAIPLYATVAASVVGLLQSANAAVQVARVAEGAKEIKAQVAKVAIEAEGVKTEVEHVKEAARVSATTMDGISTVALETREVAKSTHVMVNNNMLIQLQLTSELSHWKAEHDPTPENVFAAEKSDALLLEHTQKQAASDSLIPRIGFGVMPPKSVAESMVAAEVAPSDLPIPGAAPSSEATAAVPSATASPSPVDVQNISAEAAQAIADAVRVDIAQDVTSAVVDALPPKEV